MKNNLRSNVILLSLVSLMIFACSSGKDRFVKRGMEQEKLLNYSLAQHEYQKSWTKRQKEYAGRGLATSSFKMRNFEAAESWYRQLDNMGKLKKGDYMPYIQAKIANARFDEAETIFQRYITLLEEDQKNSQQTVNLGKSIQNGKNLVNAVSSAQVVPLEGINTEFAEFAFQVKPDASVLFSTDRFDGKPGSINRKNAFRSERYGWTGNSFLRVMTGSLDTAENKVSGLQSVDELKHPYHIGPVSEGEKYIFFSKTQENRKAKGISLRKRFVTVQPELYYREIEEDGNLGSVKRFAFNDALKHAVTDPFWHEPTQTLYFASDMAGGEGGLDLYKLKPNPDGSWGEPENLGPNINTFGDDRSAFIDAKGDFYFASSGHPGLGGLDIFVIRGGDVASGEIQNLGAPINSARDDFFYTAFGDKTYLSSDRRGSKGMEDIYLIKSDEKELIKLYGKVFDKESKAPIRNAVLTTVSKKTGVNARFISESDGSFMFLLPILEAHDLTVSATDYMGQTLELALKGNQEEREAGEKYVELLLQKVEVDRVYTIENIFYDFDQSFIREDAKPPLNELVKLMKAYPLMVVELYSHTDSRGTRAYNQKLSDRRAQAAVDYIISQGIGAGRITAKGFGKDQLVNGCDGSIECTEEQHQENRRTEFKIISY
ncbi:MAG: OmpA family protein [Nitritalea sp.]